MMQHNPVRILLRHFAKILSTRVSYRSTCNYLGYLSQTGLLIHYRICMDLSCLAGTQQFRLSP